MTDESSAEARQLEGDTATTRVTIGPGFGCEALEQRVIRFAPGQSVPHGGGTREELLFAVSGAGTVRVDGAQHELGPETGVLVAPGERYQVENQGPEELVLVSVLALEPDDDVANGESGAPSAWRSSGRTRPGKTGSFATWRTRTWAAGR